MTRETLEIDGFHVIVESTGESITVTANFRLEDEEAAKEAVTRVARIIEADVLRHIVKRIDDDVRALMNGRRDGAEPVGILSQPWSASR